MFVDLSTQPDGARFAGDVCIVGTGPAGITMALELGRRGVNVVLLESGGMQYEEAVQELYDGELVGHGNTDVSLAVLRERPEYAVPEYVTASLAAKPYSAAAMETTCPKERLAHLQMQCRADFDQDDYLIVDGWMISQTEAAFCASLA